jgi:uncharacterized protein
MTDRAALAAYLSRDDRPEGSLTLPEVYGFFFAVACAPDLVRPSEWIELLLGLGEDAPIEDLEHANTLLGALQDVYNEVTRLARSDPARLPPECPLLDDPSANLNPAAPVAAWSRGFRAGHGWLEESWDVPLPDEMDSEVGSVLTALIFFGLGDGVESFAAEIAPGQTVADVAVTIHKIFPDAVKEYAALGRILEEAQRREEVENDTPAGRLPGRNDPCPCGSGKKFKRCCGLPQH